MIFFYVIFLMFNVFGARVHKFSESVKECLLGSEAMLPPFLLFYFMMFIPEII